jgi:DNA repair exonuclease SbcCD ATPase subunit
MIAEALIWCLYGRLIRATSSSGWSPLQEGTTVEAVFADPVLTVRRTRHKKSSKVVITPQASKSVKGSNEAITAMFGSHRLCLSTRVFHQALLSRFASATDGERKTLIEELIGVGVFDAPLATVREELLDTRTQLNAANSQVHGVALSLSGIQGSLTELIEPIAPVTDVETLQRELDGLQGITYPERPDRSSLAKAEFAQEAKRRELQEAEDHRDERRVLIDAGICPTCGAEVLDQYREVDNERVGLCKLRLKKAKEELALEQRKYKDALADQQALQEEFDRVKVRRQELRGVISRQEQQLDRYRHDLSYYDQRSNQLKEQLATCQEEYSDASDYLSMLEKVEARLQDLTRIYGPSGARVVMLRDALNHVSAVGTQALHWLYAQHGQHEKASLHVTVSDNLTKIDVSMDIAGATMPYRGLSNGESSLVDFVILKALSALHSATTGGISFIYDDVLDALDEKVQDSLATFISQEATNNQVWLLTHDDKVQSMFPGCQVFKISGGLLAVN